MINPHRGGSLLFVPLFCALAFGAVAPLRAAPPPTTEPHSKLAYPGADGRLVYKPYSAQGDILPDFSHCGYRGGGAAIPDVPAKIILAPVTGAADDLPRIQEAVDALAKLPPDTNGFRGAALLKRGRYRLSGTLKIGASGIVLRGEGDGEDGTLLVATGKTDHRLIEARGTAGPQAFGASAAITDAYVPVGARSFTVAAGHGFTVGDTVQVRRVGNAAWIREIGMDRITPRPANPSSTRQWQPFNLNFDRVITIVEGNRITVDAPLTCAVDRRWGGGTVQKYRDPGRIEQVGIENLRAISEFDKSKTALLRGKPYFSDEAHASYLVGFDNVKNAWARRVTTVNFAHGVSSFGGGAKWVTVEDARAVDPVSVITGGRRYPFNVSGQLILIQRCYARDARHAFAFGSRVPGPNVFRDCRSEQDHATSEPHHRWSVGGLYDNVDARLAIQDRQWMGSGHGWAGANYVVWNSRGSLVCQKPPTAQNFAIGFVGTKTKGAFERPDGWWESPGKHVAPRSLYRQQWEDRLGKKAVEAMTPLAAEVEIQRKAP